MHASRCPQRTPEVRYTRFKHVNPSRSEVASLKLVFISKCKSQMPFRRNFIRHARQKCVPGQATEARSCQMTVSNVLSNANRFTNLHRFKSSPKAKINSVYACQSPWWCRRGKPPTSYLSCTFTITHVLFWKVKVLQGSSWLKRTFRH